MADIFTKEKRRELMKKVRNKNTDIELILRKALFKKGLRFRVKNKLFGKPDIIFPSKKVAIFCDGDFWHGKNFKKEGEGYKIFWKNKIKTNIERDSLVNKTLKKNGWKVLRFWKAEIIKNPNECAEKIRNVIIED
jgi:DNA mismatch endonuclease (patch repair protein)